MVQNSKVEDVKQTKGEEDEDGWLRKELEECREQLKKLKSELLRKEYKHDTEMVIHNYIYLCSTHLHIIDEQPLLNDTVN